MEKENNTMGTDFVLLGLFNHTRAHQVLFTLVMMAFVTSLMDNAAIILLIRRDLDLHTPMYFLLGQLSLMDVMLVFTTIPKMAGDFWSGRNSISLVGCAVQIFIFLTLEGGESFLLAAMAYDRFVAICYPSRYPILMGLRLCLLLPVVFWLFGATDGLVQAGVTMSYHFCHSGEDNRFLYEAPTLVRLACDDTMVFESVMYVCCVLMLLIPFSVILGSYGLIVGVVLQMRSVAAKKKAFTTCSSHLIVVGLFFGAATFISMRPRLYDSKDYDKVVSAFYTILTPVLDPLIYSLKNRDVLEALKGGLTDCKLRN
ncbi:olfactory receptor 2T33-like [Tachyglossus aculeatus]|uniref:olfactory receptor 2T33-like n=1 Tax=Tachyglossus aculeatus TaxID=9261 RepID=UPI0018F62667|nr:olfactory receptor 2T33-like [Tachyglossus aculeatus]